MVGAVIFSVGPTSGQPNAGTRHIRENSAESVTDNISCVRGEVKYRISQAGFEINVS